jgi:16S rRNA processing protein RimM
LGDEILLATVIGPHGLKGEARLKLFAVSAKSLGAYGPLRTRDGRKIVVREARDVKNGEAIAAFEGVEERGVIEGLKGHDLLVSRDAFPEPAADEFYHVDLIGLRAEDIEGRNIGRVQAVHNFGASDVIEIARTDGDTVLLAFTRDNIPVIDPKSGRLVVAVPEEVEAQTRGIVE